MVFKNIIFDLGGVIINLDYQRTANAFSKLGLQNFDEIYSQKKQEQLFDQFEKGAISEGDFRNVLRKHLPHQIEDTYINDAWNAMLLDIPASRLNFIRSLAPSHRIFLLSNTNIIHIAAFTAMADRKFGKGFFENTFERVYYSCLLNMRKPDKEIFELVLKENRLLPAETLFIDDSIQHVEGARLTGLQAVLLEKNTTIEEFIPGLLKH